MSSSIQLTPESSTEALALAADAVAEATGLPNTPTEPLAEPVVPDGTAAPVDSLEITEVPEIPESVAGEMDMEAVFQEYADNGESLTEETLTKLNAALAKAGFKNTQGVIDQYIAGAQSTVASIRTAAFSQVGGEDNYREMVTWAASNYTPAQLAAYNDAVQTPNLVSLAIAGLHAQYQNANGGQAPTVPQATQVRVAPAPNSVAAVGGPITTIEQISQLTADPRFDRDPGFRAAVEARIKAGMR